MREADLVVKVFCVFKEVTGLKDDKVDDAPEKWSADIALAAEGRVFLFEVKRTADRPVLVSAFDRLALLEKRAKQKAVVVLVVPFMSEFGHDVCELAGINWMDLSGNARIVVPGLRIIVRGQPNRFVRQGRPKSLFAPKSARIARVLLLNPAEAFTQAQIEAHVRLGRGYVSRLVRGLEDAGLVGRDAAGHVRVLDRKLLLDAWHDDYDFGKHTLHRAHIVSRTGEDATTKTAAILRAMGIAHAATGLSAAWLYAPFAAFRTATFYVDGFDPSAFKASGVRWVENGANLWLLEPNDAGVYEGAEERNGLRCVSAVQTYMDLKGHAERAKEAAEALRRRLLTGEA